MYCLPVGGENTLYIPTILSHILPRDTAELIWIEGHHLPWRIQHLCTYILKRMTWRHSISYSISDFTFESPNLEIKEQPSDTVWERKETFGIYVFLHCFIKFMQRGTCCPGLCLNIVMGAKHISSCQISLRDFVLHSRLVDGPHVIFNPQKLLMLQCPATGDPSTWRMIMKGKWGRYRGRYSLKHLRREGESVAGSGATFSLQWRMEYKVLELNCGWLKDFAWGLKE